MLFFKIKTWWNTREKWQKASGLYLLTGLILYYLDLTDHLGKETVIIILGLIIFHAIYFGWNKLIQILK